MKPKKLRPGHGTHSPGQYPTVPGMPHVSLPSHLPGAADLAQTQQALIHAHAQQAYFQQVSPLQPQSHQVCVTNRCHKGAKMVSHLSNGVFFTHLWCFHTNDQLFYNCLFAENYYVMELLRNI